MFRRFPFIRYNSYKDVAESRFAIAAVINEHWSSKTMRSHRWKATSPSSDSIEGGSEDVPMLHGVTEGLGPIAKHVVECCPSA